MVDSLHGLLLQLLEGRRRHLELSKQVRDTEAMAQRLETSEMEKAQLQWQVETALAERQAFQPLQHHS